MADAADHDVIVYVTTMASLLHIKDVENLINFYQNETSFGIQMITATMTRINVFRP